MVGNFIEGTNGAVILPVQIGKVKLKFLLEYLTTEQSW